ncbi:ABC transporter permease [Chelativorans sp. AA-79]|uniref:ABC transporter permease n=1 Tax=Chelativorans sp. AA-79 TaxID=3028735 RepID=UPI003211F833
MRSFIIVRLLTSIPVILVILLVSFVLTRLVPGDPIVALVGDYPAPPEFIEERRRAFGLDQPIYLQALIYFKNLFLGDFGYSFVNRLPVMELILRRAANTLLLVVPSLVIGSIVAVLLASMAIRRPGGRLDTGLTSLILFVDSIPIFWVGQVFIIVFAVQLGLFPVQGMFNIRAIGSNVVLDFLWHWALPGSIVSTFAMVAIARVARVSMIEVSRLDFITTGMAKGLSKRRVFFRHIMPNAMIPVIAVIGYSFGQALTSSFMIEAVFGWPGIGELFLRSVGSRDYPVLQGIFLLTATLVVLSNLFSDILSSLMDPRIEYGR